MLSETYDADIMYDINRAEVKKAQMTASDVVDLKNKVKDADAKENVKIKGIDISAYASPDGELAFNDKLARERSKTASAFFKKELENMKVSQAGMASSLS